MTFLLLCFNAELFGVLGVQSLPAAKLHGVAGNDPANGSGAEKMIQNIETDMPPGGAHGNVAAIDVVPKRQARATAYGLGFPADIVAAPGVLEQLGSVGSRHLR